MRAERIVRRYRPRPGCRFPAWYRLKPRPAEFRRPGSRPGGLRLKSGGFSLTRLVWIVFLLSSLTAGMIWYSGERRSSENCVRNLEQIYEALEMYELDRGQLPTLSFFPENPLQDPSSLRVVLAKYGVDGNNCLCPKAHVSHKSLGLTYVWNVNLNGRRLHGPDTREWMLAELNALSDHVPASHLGRHQILYTDGKVQPTKEPPAFLRGE